MIIETYVNFKLRNGKGVMKAGRYDDRKKPFPDEIYEEIESNRKEKRFTLRILDDTPSSAVSKSKEEDEVMDTMDKEEDVIETETKKRPRKKRKKS